MLTQEDILAFTEVRRHFEEYKTYCPFPESRTPNSRWMQFWQREEERILKGYEYLPSKFITGELYYYFNYSIMDKTVEKDGLTYTLMGAPDTWDGTIEVDTYYQEAKENKRDCFILKGRRKGLSYYAASCASRLYHFVRHSNTYVIAATKQYILGADSTMTKIFQNVDHMSEHTPFGKLRQKINKADHIRASYLENVNGQIIEKGFKSNIAAVVLDDPQKLRGKKGQLIIVEEAGSFPNLLDAIPIIRKCILEGTLKIGTILAFGTGGDEGPGFAAMETVFYKPDAYGFHSVKNIWEEAKSSQPCCFFFPAYKNYLGFIDENGNSQEKEAKDYILQQRLDKKKLGVDNKTLLKMSAEDPITPEEAMLRTKGTYFPITEAKKRLSELFTDRELSKHNVGRLEYNEDKVIKWVDVQDALPQREWPILDSTINYIEVFELPQQDKNTLVVPRNRYIGGIDPYNQDQTTNSESVGCMFIMDLWTDRIVCEYTARPERAEDFYETCRRILVWYNATAMYEASVTLMYKFFERKQQLYLLADNPSYLRDRNTWREGLDDSKGIKPTEDVNKRGREAQKTWMLSDLDVVTGTKKIDTIRSIGYLKEVINWNKDGNFDRVSAMNMLFLYREDLTDDVAEERKKPKSNRFGNFFTKFKVQRKLTDIFDKEDFETFEKYK